MALRSINPYNGKLVREYKELSAEQIIQQIKLADEVFHNWSRTKFEERSRLLTRLSQIMIEKKTPLAEVITVEMGKPLKESIAEIEKCAWVCDFYAEHAKSFLEKRTIPSDADLSYVTYEPLGVILGIMPWNFPFWQVFRFVAPTVMAGNTVLLKHASNVQGSAGEIENLFLDAGYSPGVFQNLGIGSKNVKSVIESPFVKAVSLTGSENAGMDVAGIAGRNLKKSLLELGGSNAFVVFEDADIDDAVAEGIRARMMNCGQSCIAAKRFFVHTSIMESFIQAMKKEIVSMNVGNPLEDDTEIGPLSSESQALDIERQVEESVEMGASLICGGKRNGCFYDPTLVTNVIEGMPLAEEEVFGPVLPVMSFTSDKEVVEMINRSAFGLGATLFTTDIRKAEILSREIDDGAVFINSLVKSDPRLPFGGTKNSGYGRELSEEGIKEFVNVKTIYIRK